MKSKQYLGWGAVLLAVLIVLTLVLGLDEKTHYFWALLSLVWGILTLRQK